MAYNTGNPVGSGDPRDLRDNSENLDEAINGTASTWVDRLGVTRKTFKAAENAAQQVEDSAASNIAAIEQDAADVESARDTAITIIDSLDAEAQQALDDAEEDWENRFTADQDDRSQRFDLFLANSGYQFVGDYAAGIELTEYNQVVRDASGNLWRVSASTSLPYTTTGAGLPEGGAFIAIGDADLAQNLISDPSTGQGALLVRGSVIYVDTIADLQALPTSELVDGQQVNVAEYNADTGAGGGEFYWDATATETDNGGTVIQADGSTVGRWLRNGLVEIEAFGVSTSATATENADAFSRCIEHTGTAITNKGPYNFDFQMMPINYTGSSLVINLGFQTHTFENFYGVYEDSITHLDININIDCNQTPIQHIVRSNKLESITSNYFSISNVKNAGEQCFLFQWQHDDERDCSLSFNNVNIQNFENVSSSVPMTVFGGYGGTLVTSVHNISIKNLTVKEFYSTDGAGTIISGESDFFRLFRNPCNVKIENLIAYNVGKRFLKGQNTVNFLANNVTLYNDSRFTTSVNHDSFFELQGYPVNTEGEPGAIRLGSVYSDFSETGGSTPLILASCSSLPHSINIDAIRYNKLGISVPSSSGNVVISNAKGQSLFVNAAASNVVIDNIEDSNIVGVVAASCAVSDFDVAKLGKKSTPIFYQNAELRRGIISGMDLDQDLAIVKILEDVTLNVTERSAANRPLRLANGDVYINRVHFSIDDALTAPDFWINNTGGAGKVVLRDVTLSAGGLMFMSGGDWDVTRDNAQGSVTGAGITSIKNATYT